MQTKYKYKGVDKNSKEYTSYVGSQIERHKIKSYKKRKPEEYGFCFQRIKSLIAENASMICLGTRNNHERDIFQKSADEIGCKVFSQDIAPKSGADFVGDFNYASEFVPHDWDVVYSNSIDHALSAEKAFCEWIKILKSGGIMMLGFGFNNPLSKSDCNSFTKEDLREFFNKQSAVEVIEEVQAPTYYYWVLRKK